jgi:hypothetical protein
VGLTVGLLTVGIKGISDTFILYCTVCTVRLLQLSLWIFVLGDGGGPKPKCGLIVGLLRAYKCWFTRLYFYI